MVKDHAVALGLGDVGLGVVEQPLGPVGGAKQDAGDVVGRVERLEIVLPGSVVEVAQHDDGGGGVQAPLAVLAALRERDMARVRKCIEVIEEANQVYEQGDSPPGNVHTWPRGARPAVDHLEGAF